MASEPNTGTAPEQGGKAGGGVSDTTCIGSFTVNS